jgi:hypothetical protein
MSTKAQQLLRESPAVNPRTGRAWTLTDVEVAPQVDKLQGKVLKNQATALRFLQESGFVTPKGKLTKKYGG